ncbi:MAG: DUF2125 domain-containing protein [Rhodobacteraceae bacterium]|nr:DUF2125 domain-containing protein [Paracoccaceae bacterium]
MLRVLLIAIVAPAALWSGYWWWGSHGVEDDLRAWLDGRADAGWVANYADVSTRGFPNRFDTTVTGLELADPGLGLAWTAPFFQLLRLSYEPNHIIAVWPNEQTLASPETRVTVRTGKARASLVFKPGTDLELDRVTAVFDNIRLVADAGWTAQAAEVRLATRTSERSAGAIHIGLETKQLRPVGDGLQSLAEMGIVHGVIDGLRIDATLGFDAPWDQHAVETARPLVREIELHKLQLDWGGVELWAAGDLTVDTEGLATGSITIKAKNWRELFQIAVGTGWIPDSIAGALESGLTLLAGLSGSSETLDAPLTFEAGYVSFGPVPLGSITPLRLP